MPNGWYRAQVTIPMISGLPEDAAVNMWSFRRNDNAADHEIDGAAISLRLGNFYDAIRTNYSSRVDFDHIRIAVVDLLDDTPRLPFFEADMTTGAETTTWMDLPPEVALCLSFKGSTVSGQNARRRRGRVYLGPWQTNSGPENDLYNILGTLQTAVADAAETHILENNDEIEWCVYSPYTHRGIPVGQRLVYTDGVPNYPEVEGNLFNAFTVVTSLWVDNAWDTQRRRGTAASNRVIRT